MILFVFLTICEALSLLLMFFYFFMNGILLFLLFFSCWKSLINEIELKSKKGESGLSLYVAPLGHDPRNVTNVTNVTACVISGCFFDEFNSRYQDPLCRLRPLSERQGIKTFWQGWSLIAKMVSKCVKVSEVLIEVHHTTLQKFGASWIYGKCPALESIPKFTNSENTCLLSTCRQYCANFLHSDARL